MKPIHWLFIILTAVAVILAILFFFTSGEKISQKGLSPPGPNIRISTTPFQKAASPIVNSGFSNHKNQDTSAMAQSCGFCYCGRGNSVSGIFPLRVHPRCVINISDALGDPIPKRRDCISRERAHIFTVDCCSVMISPTVVYELARLGGGL